MRRSRLVMLVLPMLLGLAVLLGPAAQTRAGLSKYEDKRYGFSIKFPDRDWSQTPTQPGEETEVAKFKDDRQGSFNTVSIYRFLVAGGGDVVTPSGGDPFEEPEAPPRRRPPWAPPDNAKDYWNWVLKRTARQYGVAPESPDEPRAIKFGKIEGLLYQAQFSHPQRPSWKVGFLAGIVDNGEEEYLIFFTRKNKLKKVLSKWTRSIRSFRFKDEDTVTQDAPDEKELAKRNKTRKSKTGEAFLDPEKRERIKQGLTGQWRFIDTRHYIVIYNCDDPLARHIAKRVEYMREFAFETVFPPVAPIEEAMVVRVCKEMDEYYHYGAPRGSAGYWSPGHDELVFPDLSRSKKPDKATIGVLNHEAFHQYIHYALLKNSLPIWFNEGFAEYFFCVESTGKKLKFMKRHPMRYSVVKSALGSKQLIPIPEFIKYTQPRYYARPSLCYSQGWAFCTWMKNITKDERYKRIPEVMFQEMQKGYLERLNGLSAGGGGGGGRGMWGEYNDVVQAAMAKAFEGIDLEQMDKDFKHDLKRKM